MKEPLNRRRFFSFSAKSLAASAVAFSGMNRLFASPNPADQMLQLNDKQGNDLCGIPAIDFHTHYPAGKNEEDLKIRLAAMDTMKIKKAILLSVDINTEDVGFNYVKSAPDRFVLFTTIDFKGMEEPGWGEKMAEKIVKDTRKGSRGLKLWLGARGQKDKMPMDDPRLDPVYAKIGELGIPVAYHCNDPEEFYYAPNRFNFWCGANHIREKGFSQRVHEMVGREEIVRQIVNMVSKHPNTTFILVHMAFLSRQLALLADILDRYPNVMLDLSADLGDLGRSHKESREFMTYYQKRILFGTDGGLSLRTQESWESFIKTHFVVLETDLDDVTPPFKRSWNVHALNLPKEAIENIYIKNAEELLARPLNL
jgi:predicted TIM-barrel fold metal-dependent hydrolase